MSIAPPVGAMSAYLSRLITGKSYRSMRHVAKELAKKFPRAMEKTAKRAEEYARGLLTGGTLFEELGFYYVGPVDGHNLDHLLPVLKNVPRASDESTRYWSTSSRKRARDTSPQRKPRTSITA